MRTFTIEVLSEPDNLGRVYFAANWQTAEGIHRGQHFHMTPEAFCERAKVNGYAVVGFGSP